MPAFRQTALRASSSAREYSVPYSVGWEMYTMPGMTVCPRFSSRRQASIQPATSAADSLPSRWGRVSTLWPPNLMAPASWVLMWPVSAATTPCQGRSSASITVALVWVPPTRKNTSAPGVWQAARILSRADSE